MHEAATWVQIASDWHMQNLHVLEAMTLKIKYLILKMETQDKKSKILRVNSTFRPLSNNTKHGPLQTYETVPLSKNLLRDPFWILPDPTH